MLDGHGRLSVDIQPAQVRAFVTVAQLRSYERAAEALFYSEPAIYAQVRKLETTLGMPLIKRHKKQLILTREGSSLVEPAVAMLDALNTFEQAARRLCGKVVVAGGEYSAPNLLMPLVALYQEQNP